MLEAYSHAMQACLYAPRI